MKNKIYLLIWGLFMLGFVGTSIYSKLDARSLDVNNFNGRLAIYNKNIFFTGDGPSKGKKDIPSNYADTTFYNRTNKIAFNSSFGQLKDSLVLNDTLYLAFSKAGLIQVDLNNPVISEEYVANEESTEHLVSEGKDIYYQSKSKVCVLRNSKNICTETKFSPTSLLYYEDKLYVSGFNGLDEKENGVLLTVNPQTMKIEQTKSIPYIVSSSVVVGKTIYVKTNESFGKIIDNTFIDLNVGDALQEGSTFKNGQSIIKMKAVGSKLFLSSKFGTIYMLDPTDDSISEILSCGRILYSDNQDIYLLSLEKLHSKKGNTLKYNANTGKLTTLDEVKNQEGQAFYYY